MILPQHGSNYFPLKEEKFEITGDTFENIHSIILVLMRVGSRTGHVIFRSTAHLQF